ncbi:MAG: flotillin-like protein FloA [Candidatus Sumerlaeota bacterium]|nr:flotillin-like protein FloA [Candidatus Sumerlaeota bacterium]
MDMSVISIFVVIIGIIILSIVFYFVPVKLYLAARFSGVSISLVSLIGMRLRRISPPDIVNPLINAYQSGVPVTRQQLESHYLSGGNVALVVNALIAANKARIPLDFDRARAIDLAGRNVFEAVRMSVEPRVIDCPDPRKGRDTIDGIAKDGIQLKVKARVTVRANLERLVGGATEETIIARVGEGIVTTIGSAESHKRVLENPDLISKRVLERGLDSGTAFEILSIDIADVDVGANIGANLQIAQADADKQIAQAKAEERRALAVAREQEMRALEQEMRARVVEAESEIPKAMAEAFRKGNMGIMDYYRMQNIKSDTEMRARIAGEEPR